MSREREEPGPMTEAVAAELRAEKGRADITDLTIARRSGVSLSSVRRYLNGERVLNLETLEKLAGAFGTTASAVLVAADAHKLGSQRQAHGETPTG